MTNLLDPYSRQINPEPLQPHQPTKTAKKSPTWLTVIKVIFFTGLACLALALLAIAFNVKHIAVIYREAMTGKSSLEEAIALVRTSDFLNASKQAERAEDSFNNASKELDEVVLGPVKYIPFLAVYKTDAQHLIKGGQSLAQALNKATAYAYGIHDLVNKNQAGGFSALKPEEKRQLLSAIYSAEPTLSEVEKSLDTGLAELNAITALPPFGPLADRVDEVKAKVKESSEALAGALPLTKLLPPLLGYPDAASYLLILQNSDELRPTGGFIGTYGIVQAKDGDITRFDTHDVYHLDMPTKDKVNVTPPEPIKKYLVPKWYLRDANWSPDFPTAARQIEWFYQQENNALPQPDPVKNVDGIIAITPELITELMKFTGPITLEGETYTPENFVDLLQYKVEKGYIQLGISSWHRKEVIGDIAKIMKERLLNVPLERWPDMIRLIGDNIARKNLLLYAKNPELQRLLHERGADGQLAAPWGDYLMVVDANMGALKTDAVMERQVNYKLEQQHTGRLKATVTLRYAHHGTVDWNTSAYRSFTRIYVPDGSKLLKITGAAGGSVASGDELGKTYFGGLITVAPKGTHELVFEYELPERMTANMNTYHNYSLTVQKQPGTKSSRLSVDARFNNAIQSYNPQNLYSRLSEKNRFVSEGDLAIDRSFLINF